MKRYIHAPEHDRRIGRGDDFAGDAWRDTESGDIRYVAVGRDPNGKEAPGIREAARSRQITRCLAIFTD